MMYLHDLMRKNSMFKKFLLLTIAAVLLTVEGRADIIMSTNTYSENFDSSLPAATTTGFFSGTTQVAIGTSGWVGARIGGSGTTASFIVDAGVGNSGALYSHGAAATTERALGAVASGTSIMGMGFKVTNNTGATFENLTIDFTQENWRSSTTATNTIAASFATSGNAADGTFLSTGTFSAITALDLVGPAPVAANGALDGNLGANQVLRSFTLSNINLAQGDSLYFRWRDVNDGGNDAGLSIDNLTITGTFAAVPEPTSLALVGLIGSTGLLAGYRRRKQNKVAPPTVA